MPRVANETKLPTTSTKDTAYAIFRFCMKPILVFAKNSFEKLFEKVTAVFLPKRHSKYRREIKIAVNKEDKIPMISVVANPRIGPVPNKYKMIAVNKVVKLESKIAPYECL